MRGEEPFTALNQMDKDITISLNYQSKAFIVLKTGSHAALVCLELPMLWRMTFSSASSSLCLLCAETAGVHQHARVIWCWGSSSGLQACEASALPTEPDPQAHKGFLLGFPNSAWHAERPAIALVLLDVEHALGTQSRQV